MHFTNYLNRQPQEVSILTPRSILAFVINNEDYDYAVIVVDLQAKKLILYDCVENRHKDTFFMQVKKLRIFLKDFFEYRPMQSELGKSENSSESSPESLALEMKNLSLEYVSEERRKSEMKMDQVDLWKYESGICTKYSSEVIRKYGQGIFILKYLDSLTQCQLPVFPDITADSMYAQITCELVTATLLNY